MDIRQLSYFVSLCEEGSTTRAARRMNVVQPALSMQITKLEDEFGQKLFDRSAHGMVPTPAGQMAYRLFAPILRDLADAKQQVASRSGEVSGRIAIGLVSSVTMSVLARTLALFTSQYPEVEISVCDGYSSALVDAVRGGTLDFALVNKTRGRSDLLSTDILEEEFVLVTASEGPHRLPAQVALRDVSTLPLILPSKRNGLRLIIDRIAEDEDIELPVKLEVDAIAAIEELLRASRWTTILPAIAVRRGLADGSLRAHRLVAPRVARQIVCVHNPRRPLSEAARLFVDVISQELSAAATQLHGGLGSPPARRKRR
ncbi:LysR family transcriptional regulator [Aquabacter sp. CN5-332]|uniref:LysR family transcriptional regulator n=1 Tax=Aquabacter sp. CN5-332 TaxID=3156608 RepID=UPI0032B5CA91